MRSIRPLSVVRQRMATRTPSFTTTTSQSHLHTVVMIRHGESLWNVENKFTGWCDVPLTPNGEADARDAGELLLSRGLKFDVAFTSNLERAWRTCAIILSSSAQSHIESVRSWRLNERHYGILQGHNKDCNTLAAAFGDEQVMEWRKSYHKSPPGLDEKDAFTKLGPDALKISTSQMNPRYLDPKLFNSETRKKSFDEMEEVIDLPLASDFPKTESLKQCEIRAFGYWNEVKIMYFESRKGITTLKNVHVCLFCR
jgi:bisphosphoglycerate-dependent phosphoglycerate mutase